MRHLTYTVFLILIMGFAGCGDMADTGGDAGAGDGANEEMTMEEAPAEEAAAMEEASDDLPLWKVLEQKVIHSE